MSNERYYVELSNARRSAGLTPEQIAQQGSGGPKTSNPYATGEKTYVPARGLTLSNVVGQIQNFLGNVDKFGSGYTTDRDTYKAPDAAQAYADRAGVRSSRFASRGSQLQQFLDNNRDAINQTYSFTGDDGNPVDAYTYLSGLISEGTGNAKSVADWAASDVDFYGSFGNDAGFERYKAQRDWYKQHEGQDMRQVLADLEGKQTAAESEKSAQQTAKRRGFLGFLGDAFMQSQNAVLGGSTTPPASYNPDD